MHICKNSTHTGIISNFRSCAQHKKNVIQGTVHRIFNGIIELQSFDVALKRSGLKINIQLSGPPIFLMRRSIKYSRRKKSQRNPPN